MVENYSDLYELIQAAIATYAKEDDSISLGFEVAGNNSCALTHESEGSKMVFMLARFSDEIKVGYAYFEAGEREPEWIDDTDAAEFDEKFVLTLIREQLLSNNLF
jgi:hypothetical protein